MLALVHLLRCNDVKLPADVVLKVAPIRGLLETRSHFNGARSRRLIVRDPMSSPDKGVLAEIFQPAIITFCERFFELRGLEHVVNDAGAEAAVLQEWRIIIVATLPIDQRPHVPAVQSYDVRR